MSLIELYFLHNISVPSFNIDVVLILSIRWALNLVLTETYQHASCSASIGLTGCGNFLAIAKGPLIRRSCLCACLNILLMAPCVTSVIGAISTCWCPSWESITMSCNISLEICRGIVWTLQNSDLGVVSIYGFTPSTALPSWLLMNLPIKAPEMYSQGNSFTISIQAMF